MSLTLRTDDFPGIYQRLRKPILQYVWRSVRDGETAEELTQEIFLKAYRSRDSYEDQWRVSTWLWTIARNTVCDWHRKEASRPRELEPECENVPSSTPDAEALIADRGEKLALVEAIKGLTKPQRRVLWLRIIHGLSYQEIAARMGLSISAAKCLFYRARLALA